MAQLASPSWILFLFTLVLGIFISVSRSNWLSAWIGLELNLLSFIPLVASSKNVYTSEGSLLYFIIQALGSATLLVPVTCYFLPISILYFILTISLILKTGAAPLHFWFPPVIQSISLTQCIILISLQKIAPLNLLSTLLDLETIGLPILLISIASRLVGSLGGLNQTQTRKILAYSAINHTAWFIAALSISTSLWTFYFSVYFVIVSTVILFFQSQQIFHISHTTNTTIPPTLLKIFTFFNLISLAGLPPLLGFFPKLFVIKSIITDNQLIWISSLLISNLIATYFYFRLTLTSFTLSSTKIKPSSRPTHLRLCLSTTVFNIFPGWLLLLFFIPY